MSSGSASPKSQESDNSASSCDSVVEQLQHEPAFGHRLLKAMLSKYTIGIISLVLVVALWIGSRFLTQDILEGYDKPFLVTFLSCLLYPIYFVFLFIPDPLRRQGHHGSIESCASNQKNHLPVKPSNKIVKKKRQPSKDQLHHHHTHENEPLTVKQTAILGLVFFVLYFSSTYACNLAYSLTSVGSAGIIMTTSGIWVLLLGRLAGTESLSLVKVLAVLIGAAGVGLLGFFESDQPTRIYGSIGALLSSVFYGAYSVYLKRQSKNEARVSQALLFAFVGVYAILFTWPIMIGLHYGGIERFELPKTRGQYIGLAVNMVFGALLPNYLWNVAFAFTDELVVAIGIACNLPITLLLDHFINKALVNWVKLVSAISASLGFILINLATIFPDYDYSLECFQRNLTKQHDLSNDEIITKTSTDRANSMPVQ